MPSLPVGHKVLASELKTITDRIDLLSAPPYAKLRQTVVQGIGNGTFVAITFDAEDLDNYSGHSTSSNTSRYTAQLAGVYLLAGKIGWAANATGRRAAKWQKNGVDIDGTQTAIVATSASDVQHPVVTVPISLAVGDYVELLGFQESGGSLNTGVGTAVQQSIMVVKWISES